MVSQNWRKAQIEVGEFSRKFLEQERIRDYDYSRVFTNSIAYPTALLYPAQVIYFLLSTGHWQFWDSAVIYFYFVRSTLVTGLFIGILLFPLIILLASSVDVDFQSTFNVLFFPVVAYAWIDASRIFFNSWDAGLRSVFLIFFPIFVVGIIAGQHSSLSAVVGTIPKNTTNALRLLAVLFSLFLALVLFSIFSNDFWVVLYEIQLEMLLLGALLLIYPVLFLIFSIASYWANKLIDDVVSVIRSETVNGALDEFAKSSALKTAIAIDPQYWDDLKGKARDEFNESVEGTRKVVGKKIMAELIALSVLASVTAFVCVLFYFFFLIKVLIPPSIIGSWIGINDFESLFLINIESLGVNHEITALDVVVLKAAIFLASLASVVVLVQALIEDSIKQIYSGFLATQVKKWLLVRLIEDASSKI